jgi:DNA-binding NarL/FixJ family response regulator
MVDDHSVVRVGIKFLVQQNFQDTSVDEANNGDNAITLFKRNNYDIIILDVNMPGTDTINLIEYFLSTNPTQNILVFTMNPEELFAKRFLKLGVKGYLHKESPDEEIVRAIWNVMRGLRYISNSLAQSLSLDVLENKKENPFEALSNREFEVTMCLIKGDSLMQISETLNLHTSTIGTHKAHIFEKLKVQNVIQLAEMAKLYGVAALHDGK